jgi:hypothetical protein
MKEIYRDKGYSEPWIERRVRGIAVRDELTGEWKKRGVKEQREYAILTAEISKATFGMTPAQYREHKALTGSAENLRDHMTDLHHARRGVHHRDRAQYRRAGISAEQGGGQARRHDRWKREA